MTKGQLDISLEVEVWQKYRQRGHK